MQMIKFKNNFTRFFVLCSLGLVCTTYAWFFQYHKPSQEIIDQPRETTESAATIVLIDSSVHNNTDNYLDQLKTAVAKNIHAINVVITHSTGTHDAYVQICTATNKPSIDAVVSIRIIQSQYQEPSLHIYRYSWGQEFITKINETAFYPLEQAYLFSKEATISWATDGQRILAETGHGVFNIKGPYACPYTTLLGVKKPALGIELCVINSNQISLFTDSLVALIESFINPLIKQRARITEL